MKPIDLVPNDRLYFRLVLRALGVDPKGFNFWKFAHEHGKRVRVRVFGRGAGAVYDVPDSESWTSQFAEDLKRGHFSGDSGFLLNKEGLHVLHGVCKAFEQTGVQAGLEMLNKRVPYRFSAIYQLVANVLINVALVDKEKVLDTFAIKPMLLQDSFCKLALKDGLFATAQSGLDTRLEGHPLGGVFESYIGVPIPRTEGGLYGTLCHFDQVSHGIDEQEFFLLESVATVLPRYLQADQPTQ
jgi:hypothetical protein